MCDESDGAKVCEQRRSCESFAARTGRIKWKARRRLQCYLPSICLSQQTRAAAGYLHAESFIADAPHSHPIHCIQVSEVAILL